MSTEKNTRRSLFDAVVSIAAILIVAVCWLSGSRPAHAQAPDPLPPADVTIWDGVGFGLGINPDQSTADPLGVTAHVATAAAPLTITTVYENTICPGGPCGITFWNPVTNVFKCFGVTFGFQAAVDVNRSAPVKTSTLPSAATFGPGDAWASGPTGIPIYVVHPGSSSFRGYPVGSPWGIQVDQSTGNILFTENSTGTVNILDPATNMRTAFAVGDFGGLRYITHDTLGRIYVTSAGLQQIIRVDSGGTVTRWAVPGGGLGFGGPTPDGITRDADGKIWFTESASNRIGRLSAPPGMMLGTASDQICHYTKPGLSNPQLIATSGSDAPLVFSSKNLQAFFTENAGNAVSLLTQREASGGASGFETCSTVPPTVSTVTPTTSTVAAFDFTKPFITVTIPPTTVTVPGFDGGPDAFGMTFTTAGERIPGILRWPLAVTGNSGPSGMTDVDAPNTVHGSFFFSSRLFQVKSRDIRWRGSSRSPASAGTCSHTAGER